MRFDLGLNSVSLSTNNIPKPCIIEGKFNLLEEPNLTLLSGVQIRLLTGKIEQKGR